MNLYCLNCGSLIIEDYRGELWAYEHLCNTIWINELKNIDNIDKLFEDVNYCKVFTTEDNVLMNESIFYGMLSFSHCKECKTMEEHIEKVVQGYLGRFYKKFTPENSKFLKFKQGFIKNIEDFIKREVRCNFYI